MNMNVVRRVCLGLLLAPAVWADSITLKSGEKLEGRITNETPQEVTIDVKVSASIVDSRTVPQAEIASVAKPTAEDLSWQEVQGLKLGENSLPLENYNGPLMNLQSFVDRFPQSPHAAEVGLSLGAFAEEKRRVQAGDVKIAGKWLSREEVTRERYQISAQLLFAQIQDLTRRGDVAGALNAFDSLEKNYPGARVFPDAVDFARQVMASLKTGADRTLQNWKLRKVERVKGLALASEPARSELKAAQEREEKAADATLESAQKAGLKWSPLQAIGEKSATYLASRAVSESKRLEALPVAKMRQSLQQSDAGMAALAKHDEAGALESFRGALTLWNANEVASRQQKTLTATPVRTTPAPVTAPEATPEPVVAAKAAPAATPRPAVALATPSPASEEEKGGSHTMLYGVIALAVLGLGFGAMKFLKKKPDETDLPAE